MSNAEIRAHLVAAQSDADGKVWCGGCGEALRPRFMELDQIQPRSDRGANDISNRILLCGPCNKTKSNLLTLSGLREKNRKAGEMVDETQAENAVVEAQNRYEALRYRVDTNDTTALSSTPTTLPGIE